MFEEHSYEPFYQNIVTNYTNTGARAAVIKQYAGQVERQEGRKRIDYRLTMRVSNTVLSSKKPSLFCSRKFLNILCGAVKIFSIFALS